MPTHAVNDLQTEDQSEAPLECDGIQWRVPCYIRTAVWMKTSMLYSYNVVVSVWNQK